VRWLRPEFQLHGQPCEQAEIETAPEVPALPVPAAAVVRCRWPTGPPERIKTVAETLTAGGTPLTLVDLEARFGARGRRRDCLPVILDALAALGRVRRPGGDRQTLPAGRIERRLPPRSSRSRRTADLRPQAPGRFR